MHVVIRKRAHTGVRPYTLIVPRHVTIPPPSSLFPPPSRGRSGGDCLENRGQLINPPQLPLSKREKCTELLHQSLMMNRYFYFRPLVARLRPLSRGGIVIPNVALLHVNGGAIHRTSGSHLCLLGLSLVPFYVVFWRGLRRFNTVLTRIILCDG